MVLAYDVFISHASEDKNDVARPLAVRLEQLGIKVWLDEHQLTVGDSLRRSIDKGLIESRFGIVVLSPSFFKKEWPNKELDGLVARDDGSEKVILPVWHQVTATEIRQFSPILADRIAISTQRGIDAVAHAIYEAVNARTPPSETLPETPPETTDSISVGQYEQALLTRLRTQMITAQSSRDLRRAVYEIEEHLSLYPNSPKARMLQNELSAAMNKAMFLESPPVLHAPTQAPTTESQQKPKVKSIPCILFEMILLVISPVIIIVIVVILLTLIGVL